MGRCVFVDATVNIFVSLEVTIFLRAVASATVVTISREHRPHTLPLFHLCGKLVLKFIFTQASCSAVVHACDSRNTARIGLSLVVQRPRFQLPPEVSTLTGGEFQSMVRPSTSTSHTPGPPTAWLVMFHADWCSASGNIQPMFGALARRFVLLRYL